MVIRKSIGERIFDIFNHVFLGLVSVLTIYPFIYVVFASLSDPVEMTRHQGILLRPIGFSVEAYNAVFQNPNIGVGYKNTLIYVFGGTFINLLLTSFGAYALSRKTLESRNKIMLAIVFTMMFSGGMIPTYLLVKNLNMLDTMWALLIPNAVSTWNLIIMRTSFMAIPDSLEESAKIDGANDFTILFKVVLPLSKAVLAVIILFYAVYHWNAWFNAAIYLRKREFFPLQLILREILIENDTNSMMTGASATDKVPIGETIKYATIVVSTLPILMVYPMLQNYFIKGVMVGAVKG